MSIWIVQLPWRKAFLPLNNRGCLYEDSLYYLKGNCNNILQYFQTYILRVLALVPSEYMNIWMQRAEWSRNNLRDTPEILDSWEMQLIEERYISKEKIDKPNVIISGNPPKFAHEPIRIKIEQKGIDYLASGFEITQIHINLEDRVARLNTSVERIKKEKNIIAVNKKYVHPLPVNANEKMVVEYLGCLKGKWQGIKIMSDKEHDKLIEYTTYIIEK